MSRSVKRTPVFGITRAPSEKHDKRIANRRWRSRVRQAVHMDTDPPMQREVSNVWDFAKDGKKYRRSVASEDMRK